MTPAELADLACLPLFPQGAADLIAVCGLEATAALITAWPSRGFPVPFRAYGGNDQGARRWEQLVEIVGETAAKRIVRHWGGDKLYIPSCSEAARLRQQDSIRADYDYLTGRPASGGLGWSHIEAVWELGTKYGCADRTIEKALGRPDNPRPDATGWGQLSLL